MNDIKKGIASSAIAGILALGAMTASAAEDIAESARAGCQKEITSFCKDVTPGEGRVLQCLAAHKDKLSNRCNYVLYDAAAQLDRLATAIKYVAMECKADLDKHCGDIAIGDGRIAKCLQKNQETLAPDCKQALKDTQMEIK
jgi:Cysteine rich repeat